MFHVMDRKGNVLAEFENPAMVIDIKNNVIHFIGDRGEALTYFQVITQKFKKVKKNDHADSLCYVELPYSQIVIDKIFHDTEFLDDFVGGYFGDVLKTFK